MRKADKYYLIYKKYSIWIYAFMLALLFAAVPGWVPFSRNKVYGAILAILAGWESVFSFLARRIDARWKIIYAYKQPVSFWVQIILLLALSIYGIIWMFVG